MLFMGKSFRSDDLNQSLLLPSSLHDWLPENYLARFMVDVVETLDLSAIHASYDAGDGRGQSAYTPAMMVTASRWKRTPPHGGKPSTTCWMK
jgi:transposase